MCGRFCLLQSLIVSNIAARIFQFFLDWRDNFCVVTCLLARIFSFIHTKTHMLTYNAVAFCMRLTNGYRMKSVCLQSLYCLEKNWLASLQSR